MIIVFHFSLNTIYSIMLTAFKCYLVDDDILLRARLLSSFVYYIIKQFQWHAQVGILYTHSPITVELYVYPDDDARGFFLSVVGNYIIKINDLVYTPNKMCEFIHNLCVVIRMLKK